MTSIRSRSNFHIHLAIFGSRQSFRISIWRPWGQKEASVTSVSYLVGHFSQKFVWFHEKRTFIYRCYPSVAAAAHTCLLFAHLKIVRNSESTQIHKSHYKQSLWVKIICIYGIFPITELKTNKFVRNWSIGIQKKIKK